LLGCGVVGVLFGGGFVFGLCGVFVVGVGCVVRGLYQKGIKGARISGEVARNGILNRYCTYGFIK
jgi:hypothetical protein